MLHPLVNVPEETEELEQNPAAPSAEEAAANVHPADEPEEDDAPLMHPEDMERMELEGRDPRGASKPAQDSDEAPVDPKIQALLDRIAALEQRAAAPADEPGTGMAPPNLDEVNLFGDGDDPTDFTLSSQGLNEMAKRIVNASVQAALRLAQPTIITEANRAIASYEYSKQFYAQYPELRDKGNLVSELSAKIEAENPAVQPNELFVEVAKRAYSQLGIPMPRGGSRKPGFANPVSAAPIRGAAPGKRSTTDDVLDILKHKGKLG